MKIRDHAHLASVLMAAHASLQAVAALIFVGIFIFGAAFVPEIAKSMADDGVPPDGQAVVGVFLAAVLGITMVNLVAQTALGFFAAYGTWQARSWGKVVAIMACCFWVLSFPLGTALGVYGLWFLFGRAGEAWFKSAGQVAD
jgi:hypothetical protein